MPTFVYMSACDGCGLCVDICPSDIMHLDRDIRRAYNIEPDYCWECYSCVKACPQHAIDMRGYADFSPLGHGLTVLREEDKGRVSWKVTYRNGQTKEFTFPIRSTRPNSIRPPDTFPQEGDMGDQLLAHEPGYLKVEKLPGLQKVE
ncbi:MAG: adenylyl-sulfate reductase subunit beta [Nitrososphaerota archaeon]|nr:adenylyl-sulfate reductase subunit beta [Nitrososphaerota archaeon]MDG6940209.1 adenylyl-sulfate reductase subunit beta [Nitrososphaerota archaeon]